MSANVDEKMSLRACEGGARGCDPSSPARGGVAPESAGQIRWKRIAWILINQARELVMKELFGEDVEVLWLGDEVAVKIGKEKFRIPIKEVA
jgi:hypothetical protein